MIIMKNLRIDLDLSGDLPELQIDKDAVSRVIINLIKNSIEAKKEDGILNIKIKSRFKKR